MSFQKQSFGASTVSDLVFVLSVYALNGTWLGFHNLTTGFQVRFVHSCWAALMRLSASRYASFTHAGPPSCASPRGVQRCESGESDGRDLVRDGSRGRFPSSLLQPVSRATRTTRKCGRCPSLNGHFLSPRAKP
jgi:hypothetical protein